MFISCYKSEPVDTDAYFLAALRYIMQNPMKAGIEETPGSYPWSSYGCYAGKSDGLTDMDMAVELIGWDRGRFETTEKVVEIRFQENTRSEKDKYSDNYVVNCRK